MIALLQKLNERVAVAQEKVDAIEKQRRATQEIVNRLEFALASFEKNVSSVNNRNSPLRDSLMKKIRSMQKQLEKLELDLNERQKVLVANKAKLKELELDELKHSVELAVLLKSIQTGKSILSVQREAQEELLGEFVKLESQLIEIDRSGKKVQAISPSLKAAHDAYAKASDFLQLISAKLLDSRKDLANLVTARNVAISSNAKTSKVLRAAVQDEKNSESLSEKLKMLQTEKDNAIAEYEAEIDDLIAERDNLTVQKQALRSEKEKLVRAHLAESTKKVALSMENQMLTRKLINWKKSLTSSKN